VHRLNPARDYTRNEDHGILNFHLEGSLEQCGSLRDARLIGDLLVAQSAIEGFHAMFTVIRHRLSTTF
jgi:hypothetical protein